MKRTSGILIFAACVALAACGGGGGGRGAQAPAPDRRAASRAAPPPPSPPRCAPAIVPTATSCKPLGPQGLTPEVEAAALGVRNELFNAQMEAARATRTFRPVDGMTDEERDASLHEQLAEIDARLACGGLPDLGLFPSFEHVVYEGTNDDPPLVSFSGAVPTDVGGLGDYGSSWELLAVKIGCEWMLVEGGAGGGVHRDPTGRRLLVREQMEDQCGARLDVFVVRGPKPLMVFEGRLSRPDMVRWGVCTDLGHVVTIERGDMILGFQAQSRTDENAPWTVYEERRFRGAELLVVPPSAPIDAAP